MRHIRCECEFRRARKKRANHIGLRPIIKIRGGGLLVKFFEIVCLILQ
nr:MAG TPA: hypothetical protein [Caudoviricetes sp.]